MAGLTMEVFPESGMAPPLLPGDPHRLRAVAVSGAGPEVMLDILRPETNLVVWNRTVSRAMTLAFRPLLASAPFCTTAEGPVEQVVTDLLLGLPAPTSHDLALDLRDLAAAFAAIAATAGKVRMRLEGIIGPACHRWHADAVGLRLLCTYCGPGTEWLPIAGGAGAARDLRAGAPPRDRARIATGAVAILKGEGFSGNAGFGCIHRSPPAGPGERARLLLCIDEPGRIPLE